MGIPSQDYTFAENSIANQDPRRILVVDDDPTLVHLLKEDLGLEGHQVSCAYDGQMAMRLVRQNTFHLIILDVNMPMTNGLKVFQFLRTSPETAKIPIIFVTGELSKDVYPAIADAPRVAHLKKPLDLESFNSLVRHFLEQYA